MVADIRQFLVIMLVCVILHALIFALSEHAFGLHCADMNAFQSGAFSNQLRRPRCKPTPRMVESFQQTLRWDL